MDSQIQKFTNTVHLNEHILEVFMKNIMLSLVTGVLILLPGIAFAGCDHGVADAGLTVAEEMSEKEILALIEAAKDAIAKVEQAQVPS